MRTTSSSRRPSGTLDYYLRDISRFPVIDAEEERALARATRDGDRRAAQELVRANLRFVVRIANDYRGFGLNVCDLIQEGNIGLMVAARKFDPDRGCRLVSYASWWIRA